MIRLSLDALEALDAIDRAGSFAGAAIHLRKAQSAVSYQIRQLEDGLGVAVFDRAGHRARLTPAGVRLLVEGRALLQQARRVEGLAVAFRDGWEPRLQVVVDGVLPMHPIMEALAALEQEGVPTHVQITTEFLRGVQRRFERDDADLMLVVDVDPSPGRIAEALPAEELVLVATPDHPVHAAGPHDSSSLRRFLELSVHDSSEETIGRDTNTAGGGRVFYVSDFRTKLDGLRRGLGYGWIPLRFVHADLARGTLREVAHRERSRWVLPVRVVHRAERPLGRCGLRFLDVVRAHWTDPTPE